MRAKLFWNAFANKYSQSPISNMKWYKHTLAATKKFLNKKQSVLEIGCGTGTTALKLAHSVKHYTATDFAPNMIAIGKEKAAKQKVKNVDFKATTLFDEELKPNSYDVIMAFNLIHLLKDRDAVMKRVNELLKPNGVFVSKTPCLGEKKIMHVLAFFLRSFLGPVRCFTLKQFKDSLEKNNFKIAQEHTYAEDPPRLFVAAKKV